MLKFSKRSRKTNMFRSLVSNLPFSPALIGQLGFYAGRLRREEASRRLGLVFTALALVVQSFAVINPPEVLAGSNPNNVIFEGVQSREDLLRVYDANIDSRGNRDIQEIFTYYGITRTDLENTRAGKFNSRDFNAGIWSVGRNSYSAGTASEQSHQIPNTDSTVFSRKLASFDRLEYTQRNGSTYDAMIGSRADGSWFAVMFDCGNLAYTQLPPPPPEPTAACSGLSVTALNRTKYRLNASANLKNGATASSYDFNVFNNNGDQVAESSVVSTSKTASTEIEIPNDGEYIARVVVQTSQGPQTGSGCEKPFTVSPEPPCVLNPALPQSSPRCKPCPSDSGIWLEDERCKPDYEAKKIVSNDTQDVGDATGNTAKAGDDLTYTLTVKNIGRDSGEYSMRDNISDVLEYADITDQGGGILEKDNDGNTTGFISWPAEAIAPGAVLTKTIKIQVKSVIPSTPQNAGNPESYNCVMTNSFGASTNVNVDCPPAKVVENTVKQLPSTGPGENMLFGGVLLMVVTYFYARSRQLNKEVRLVRKEFASGAL